MRKINIKFYFYHQLHRDNRMLLLRLSRRRPVLIFEDIAHIIKGRRGIFVSKRDLESFIKTSKHIIQNYGEIQKDIEKNNFPLEKDMFQQIASIVKRSTV